MASINSYADIIRDWQMLLDAAAKNPDVQETLGSGRETLAQALTEAQGLKSRQDELKALRQEVTQQLNVVLTRGKEVALQVRAVAKARIGVRNERLVHFQVAPLRKRPRKTKEKETAKKPNGEAPATPSDDAAPSPSVKPVV